MKKIFGAVLALIATAALAQTFPVQNLQVNGNATLGANVSVTGGTVDGVAIGNTTAATGKFTTLNATGPSTLNGAVASQGTSTAALTTDQAQVTAQLNNATATAEYIYGAAIGAVGQTVYDAAGIRGVATQTAGSTNWTVDGLSGFVLNNQAGGTATKSAVGVFGVNICAVDNCQSWGMDSIVTDTLGFTAATTGVGRQLYGNESDLNVSSPNTNGIAYFAGGTALTSGAYLVGFQLNKLGGGAGAKWSRGFVSPDGNATSFGYVGLASTGASQSSQDITFAYTDSGGTEHYPQIKATPNGLQTTAAAIIPGSANTTTLGSSTLPFQQVYTQLVTLAAYTVSTLPTCNASLANALAAVTDANAPSWNATLTGGGSVHMLAFCNGTNWTAH
ncbi:hypothetical protein [Burkholderia sp. Ac-20344]|uniref:hypothetical protein n=1 Tax=Burkholderia sp. Ac-20344 TaxID=2703890 RepID=UPI00197C2F4D|nr:hypothetical protein [Burkholderia sp. Ac-20344]MBN3833163.1 hypothetical protein [Burkholderia sp. Ac-20344]